MITKDQIKSFPTTTGVYLFKKNNHVIYVGKSVSIKSRLLSHLENARLDVKENLIISEANKIVHIVTDSEFNALILESELIKKHKPKYNVIWKDNKSFLYIKITVKDSYPKVLLVRKENDGKSVYFGPFSSVRVCSMLIKEIRRIVPFCTQPKISGRACFYSKIGLCNPCPNEISQRSRNNESATAKEMKRQYRKNIRTAIDILKGNTTKIVNNFQKQIKEATVNEKYEEGITFRNKLIRLEQLFYKRQFHEGFIEHDFNQSEKSLLSLKKTLVEYIPAISILNRIECYDISNLNHKNATASMVVLNGGVIDKSQYRKFKIKDVNLRSDFERINEVILRRLNNNWPKPDLIVIDGGKPQVRTVMKIINYQKLNIPIVGIAKNPDRLIIGSSRLSTLRLSSGNPGFNIIRLLRDESHRFAKKYHLLLRNKEFLV